GTGIYPRGSSGCRSCASRAGPRPTWATELQTATETFVAKSRVTAPEALSKNRHSQGGGSRGNQGFTREEKEGRAKAALDPVTSVGLVEALPAECAGGAKASLAMPLQEADPA